MSRRHIKSVHLRGLLSPVKTWSPARGAPGAIIDYIDLSSIDNELKQITSPQRISADEAPSRARQLVHTGDILVSTVRPNLNGVARVPTNLDEATASTGYCVLRPDPAELWPDYLFEWVRTPVFVAEMVKRATGASYPAVSDRIILESEIPLPPLAEQRHIAAILGRADELQQKRRAAIARLDALAPAIFAEMFGDWRFASSKWRLVPLGSKLDFLTSGSRGWAEFYRDRGAKFLRIQNVKRDHLDLSDIAFVEAPATAEARRTRVQSGDVLLSITADLGRTAAVPDDIGEAYINQHLAILRSSALVPRFLSATLACPAGQADILKKNREGVKAGVNFDDVRSIQIPDAPLCEQRTLAERLSEIDKLKFSYCAHLAKLEALFASLQHRAFNGKLTSKDAERELEMVG